MTDFVTKNKHCGTVLSYKELDIGSSLDENNKYFDREFGNEVKCLGFKSLAEEVQWLRPSQFMKGDYFIFEGLIEPKDIKQGRLGDCYLLSALASISEYPFIVKRIFETTTESSYGAYGIWLFIDGLWKCIIVDDRIPVVDGSPIFSRANNNELWVILIEKAYAKLFGSYEIIESGLTGTAMNTLTGAPFEYLCRDSHSAIDSETAWKFISSHLECKHLVTGSTEKSDRNVSFGLVSTHAYSILDCREIRVGNKKERVLQLGNPWGRHEWQGYNSLIQEDGQRTPMFGQRNSNKNSSTRKLTMGFSGSKSMTFCNTLDRFVCVNSTRTTSAVHFL